MTADHLGSPVDMDTAVWLNGRSSLLVGAAL